MLGQSWEDRARVRGQVSMHRCLGGFCHFLRRERHFAYKLAGVAVRSKESCKVLARLIEGLAGKKREWGVVTELKRRSRVSPISLASAVVYT